MGRECSTQGSEEECIQGFGGKSGETSLGNLVYVAEQLLAFQEGLSFMELV
jgi:hypothetical protein